MFLFKFVGSNVSLILSSDILEMSDSSPQFHTVWFSKFYNVMSFAVSAINF